jgi:amicyanin
MGKRVISVFISEIQVNHMKKVFALLSLILVAALVSGCTQQNTGQNTNPAGDGNTNQASNTVVIKNFAFSPQEIRIKVGDTVTWINEDSAPHIVASDPHPTHTDLPGLESSSMATGQSYTFQFTKAGTFGYHCHIHPSMKGTVIVE